MLPWQVRNDSCLMILQSTETHDQRSVASSLLRVFSPVLRLAVAVLHAAPRQSRHVDVSAQMVLSKRSEPCNPLRALQAPQRQVQLWRPDAGAVVPAYRAEQQDRNEQD